MLTGKAGARLKTDDSVDDVISLSAHDSLLFFTSDGLVRSIKAHQVPEASRTSIGTVIAQVSVVIVVDKVGSWPREQLFCW